MMRKFLLLAVLALALLVPNVAQGTVYYVSGKNAMPLNSTCPGCQLVVQNRTWGPGPTQSPWTLVGVYTTQPSGYFTDINLGYCGYDCTGMGWDYLFYARRPSGPGCYYYSDIAYRTMNYSFSNVHWNVGTLMTNQRACQNRKATNFGAVLESP